MQIPPDWLLPDWPAPTHVQAVFTTRQGGVSRAPYEAMNLGDHVGDDPAAVARNRQALAQALGVTPHYLQQVHGTALVELPLKGVSCADAVMTHTPRQVCTIMVADCLPVLLTDRAGRFVAAAHAGWRGLASGVLQQTLRRVMATYQTHATEIIAWLGPCIGPRAFEVGPEVQAAFVQQDAGNAQHFKARGDKFDADLPALARDQLKAEGVNACYGNDSSDDWCTLTQASRFFSHRRDRVSGRMAACIWLR